MDFRLGGPCSMFLDYYTGLASPENLEFASRSMKPVKVYAFLDAGYSKVGERVTRPLVFPLDLN